MILDAVYHALLYVPLRNGVSGMLCGTVFIRIPGVATERCPFFFAVSCVDSGDRAVSLFLITASLLFNEYRSINKTGDFG